MTMVIQRFWNAFHATNCRVLGCLFFKLLDIDFENGCSCPDCPGDGPEIIICDGTSLSFQRRMWSWKNTEMPTKTSSKKKSGCV